MQSARGGYTVVEVMIALAVSMVIFFAAVTLFAGKQGKTEFSQAMRDIESKIQSIVNDVGVSTFPEASNYTCTVQDSGNGPRPKLTSAPGGTGTNKDCIFLGKAIQLDPDSDPDSLVIHTVLGRRAIGTTVVTNFNDANPESVDELIETYNVPWGATISSARQDVAPTSRDTYLMGFYNSLQVAGSAEGGQSLKTIGYAGINPAAATQVENAIRGLPGPYTLENSKVWTICFQSGTSNETAALIINSSFAGVTTKIKYSCS